MVICTKCKKDLAEDKFYSSDNCYRCVYMEKISCYKLDKKIRTCRVCDVLLPTFKWKYCGLKCAAIGKKRLIHWTARVISQNVVMRT